MSDVTDRVRKAMIETGQPQEDLANQDQDARAWDSQQLQADFTVIGFAAPFVVVRRKSDSVVGTLEFTHHPRVYFGFEEAR